MNKERGLKRKSSSLLSKVKSAGDPLKTWNSFGLKENLGVRDMLLRTPYKIFFARRTCTKYAERIVLELEEYQLYLPERYIHVSTEDLKLFDSGTYQIVKESESKLLFRKYSSEEVEVDEPISVDS